MEPNRYATAQPRQRLSIFRVGKLVVVGCGMFIGGLVLGTLMDRSNGSVTLLSPLGSLNIQEERPNPYAKYTFDALRSLNLTPTPIIVESVLDSDPTFTSYVVSWQIPNLDEPAKPQRVTGQMNIPNGRGPFPVIIMLRGYVERKEYQTGVGTRNGAAELAKNGYITIAPDFLGYGGSDAESSDGFLARFARPITVLQLLRNLDTLTLELSASANDSATTNQVILPDTTGSLFDTTKLGIWAHSNGGQIALSVLEITSRAIPTTLWAPVSKPFPYSVLYYSDELPDQGKYLRRQLAEFEYDLPNQASAFSVLNEPSRILAPIQIHQGGADDAIPVEWSLDLAQTLKDAKVTATLYTYPAADHNLQPNWNEVVQRDLRFFAQELR